ncbi:MBL fold metallo-hydrolase [Spirochaetota bacterium]
MEFKFLGVRGSVSAPDTDRVEIGNNTTCLELINKKGKLFFDIGTGIIKQVEYYNSNPKEDVIDIILTHTHLDHIIGFPFFTPIFNPKFTLNIRAPFMKKYSIKEVFENLMSTPFFPVNLKQLKANINFSWIKEKEELTVNGFKVSPMVHVHPIVCFGYRIEADGKTLVFLTDTEHVNGIDDRVVELAKDADVLIHDSQYFPEEMPFHKSWGHSCYEQAIQVKQMANAKQLYLFHHDPLRSDKEQYRMLEQAKKIDEDVELAVESRKYIKV